MPAQYALTWEGSDALGWEGSECREQSHGRTGMIPVITKDCICDDRDLCNGASTSSPAIVFTTGKEAWFNKDVKKNLKNII